jgi:hypothetical protein
MNVQVSAVSERQGTVLLALTLVATLGRDGDAVALGVAELGARVVVGVAAIGVCVGRTVWVSRAVGCVAVTVAVPGGRNSVGVAVANTGVPVRVGVVCAAGVPVGEAAAVSALVGIPVTATVGVAVKSMTIRVLVGDGVSLGAMVAVSLGVAAGAIGVSVAVGSGAAAQIVSPSKISQPSESSAWSIAAFSASTSKPLEPLPPAQPESTHHSAMSQSHPAARRYGLVSDRRLIVDCMTFLLSRTQNGVAVIRMLRNWLVADGSSANSSARARTAASRRRWNSGKRAGSMLR